MYCLKCGRDTTDDHVFCDSCQKNMAAYPVAPGTAVHLPHHTPPKKAAPRKRAVPLEEQVQGLRRSLRRSRIFATILVIILIMTATLILYKLTDIEAPVIGQNYTIDTNLTSD